MPAPPSPYKFTFQSLRGERVPTSDAPLTVGPEYESEFASTIKRTNPNAARFFGWCLLPCLFVGFVVFAVLGAGYAIQTVDDQSTVASLIGGRLYPSPPAPPPALAATTEPAARRARVAATTRPSATAASQTAALCCDDGATQPRTATAAATRRPWLS